MTLPAVAAWLAPAQCDRRSTLLGIGIGHEQHDLASLAIPSCRNKQRGQRSAAIGAAGAEHHTSPRSLPEAPVMSPAVRRLKRAISRRAGCGCRGACTWLGRRPVNARVVEPDKIGRPLPMLLPSREQRRIGGHRHQIAVAQESGHERGFRHRGPQRRAVLGGRRGRRIRPQRLSAPAVPAHHSASHSQETTGAGGSNVRRRCRQVCRS